MIYNLENVEEQINTFDKMKFIDEDGKEKISGRELSKALGYSKWKNFKNAINRTNDQIKASGGADSDVITEVGKDIKISMPNGGYQTRTVSDYTLTRSQAIKVANNADTSKPQVAMVQEYLYDTSEIGEKTINICKKLKDREYIENRSALSISNNNFSSTCLQNGVKENELGIIHNSADESLYHMSTNEIKDKYGKTNRPKADFIGSALCHFESAAKDASAIAINNDDSIYGLSDCKDITDKAHDRMRDYIIDITGKTPEELITGEDIKKVEQNYKKLTEKQLKAIEEFS